MRKLYSSGQEVEVKRARDDGYVWAKARVLLDDGRAVMVEMDTTRAAVTFAPDSVRKPGEDKR